MKEHPIDQLKRRIVAIRTRRHQVAELLDDAAYRDLLQRTADVTSTTQIKRLAQADAGLREFDRLGLGQPAKRRPVQADKKPANEWAFVFSLPVETQALAKKIYRCAQKIGALQEPKVKIMPKAWVEGIIAQSKGYKLNGQVCKVVAPLETCGPVHMHVLIQILESWAKKLEEAKHA